MAKKPTAKELRTKVTETFESAFKARGWCTEARNYLKKLGFLPEKEVTVTVKFRYNGSKDQTAIQALFERYGAGIIGATKVSAVVTDAMLEPDFDSLSYDEAVKKLHSVAHQATRDYSMSTDVIRAILEAADEPLPPPTAVRVTVTLDGVAADPEYVQRQIGKALAGWNDARSASFTPEGDLKVEVKPRKGDSARDTLAKLNPF